VNGPADDGALARIREDPASDDARELLGALMYDVLEDIPVMSSVDVPRLRALARLLDDIGQHQRGAERAAAKASAACADAAADLLAGLGRIAARELGGW
jgi:hypothetical protein